MLPELTADPEDCALWHLIDPEKGHYIEDYLESEAEYIWSDFILDEILFPWVIRIFLIVHYSRGIANAD